MSVTNVGIKLTLDGAQQAESGLRRVKDGLEGLGNTAEAVRGAMGQLAGAFAGVVSVQAFVQAADAVTTLQNQLKLATGSTQAATQAYGQLFEIAQRSRVSFTELGGTFATIARATESLGLSQQQLLGVTEAIGNAITVSGSSAAASQAALVQLGQGLAAGALRGEELNSILEQTPRLARALADGLGVSVGQLRKLGEEGKLTAEAVIAALQSQASVLAREVQNSTVTVSQAFTQLKNEAVNAVGSLDGATGASTALAAGLQTVAQAVKGLGTLASENTVAVQAIVGAVAGASVIAALGQAAVAVRGLAAAWGLLTAAMAANPIGAVAVGLAAVGGAAVFALKEWQKSESGIKNSIKGLEQQISTSQEALERARARGADASVRQIEGRIAENRAKIAELRAELAAMDKSIDTRAEDARLARYQAEAVARMNKAKAAAAEEEARRIKNAKRAADEFAKSVERGVKLADDLAAQDGGLSPDFAEKWRDLANAYKAGEKSLQELTAAQAQLLEQQPFAKDLAKEQADALKKQEEAAKALAKAEFERIEALERSAESAEGQLQRLLDEEQALSIAAAKNITLAQALEEVAIARLRERQAALMAEGDRDAEVLAIQREIDARKQLAEAIGRKEAREAAADSAKDAEREWKRSAENIERTLTDALMRGFESGKDFARVLRDTVVNMFKSLVIRPVIQAIVAPVAGGITGALGLPGTANAATGGPGAFGMASSLKSIYDTVVGGFTALGNSVAFAAQDIGAWLVNNTTGVLNQFGGSLMSNAGALGTAGSYLGGAGAGLALGKLISGGYSAIGKSGNTANVIGTGVGAFFGGPIGAAIGGAVGGLVNRAFGRKLADQGIQGTFTGDGFTGENFKFYKGGLFRSDKTKRSALDPKLDQALDQQFMALKTSVLDLGSALGIAGTALDGFTSSIKVSFKGLNEQQIQEKLNEVFGNIGEQMAQQVLGATQTITERVERQVQELVFTGGDEGSRLETRTIVEEVQRVVAGAGAAFLKEGETAAQALQRLAGSLVAVNGAFDALGRTMLQASLQSGDLASKIVEAFGGLDQFNAATASYFQNFYTDTERLDTAKRQLRETFSDLGLALPATKDAYRQLVDAQDLTTESGRKTYAALLTLSGAFADVTDAATNAAKQARATALDNLRQAIEREKRLLQLQADAASALADEVRGVFDVLTDAVRELRVEALTPIATAAQGQQTIREALVTVRAGGGLPDEDTISNAIGQARSGLGIENFGSLAEQRFEQLRLAGDLDELARYAGDQLTTAERQLLVAQQQMEALDETLVYWQDMIAKAEAGIEVNRAGYESVTEAIQDLQEALKPGSTGRNVGTASPGISKNNVGNGIWLDGSDPNSTNDAYRRNISDLPDFQKKNWQYVSSIGQYVYIGPYSMAPEDDYRAARLIEAFYSPEADMRDTFDMLAGPQGAGSGRMLLDSLRGRVPDDILNSYEQEFLKDTPKLAVGTNYVPKDVLAFIHEGEAVVPKAYNPAAGAPQITTKRMESLIEGLTAEVQRLQMIVNDGNTYARRTAQAVNGQPEAPMLVVTA